MFPVTEQTNSRLLKSLSIIVLVNIGGYMISDCFFFLITYLMQIFDFLLVWRLSFVVHISVNFGAACNAPVLYFTRLIKFKFK